MRKHVWLLLTALLTLTLLGLGQKQAATEAPTAPERVLAQWQDGSQSRQQQAAIESSRNHFRVGNTRPQRLLPSQGGKGERTTGKLPHAHHALYRSTLKRSYGARAAKMSSPQRPCRPRDYYIIALRHIIR